MEILYKMLRDRCDEIQAEGEKPDKINQLMHAYDRVIHFSNVSRKEGLLELLELVETLDRNDISQDYFYSLISLIADGTDPDLVREIGINDLISTKIESYEGLIAMIHFRGALMIQAGDHPYVIERMLKSLLPTYIKNELERRNCEVIFPDENSRCENIIEKLCVNDKEIDMKDHSLINQTAISFVIMSDRTIQRLLCDEENKDIAITLKALPGQARKRIFDNISPRIGVMIADDMEHMGPVRLCDVEDACEKMLRKIIKLSDYGEIIFDTAILKVVLDIHEDEKNKNKELREEYKEIKQVIDEIYDDQKTFSFY